MISELQRNIEKLGNGKTIKINSGENIFKLDSYENNPVVKPHDIGLTWTENGKSKIGAVFNCGAEIFQDKVILMPRCHKGYKKGKYFDEKLGIERSFLENYISEIWPLISGDGIHFCRLQDSVIRGDGTDHSDFVYGIEDIRIIKYNKKYLLIGCGKIKPAFKGSNADRIAIYSTENFINIIYHGIVETFDSRNAVLFPEEVNGKQYILLRFHPNIHLGCLETGVDQLLNPSKHKKEWERIYQQADRNILLKSGQYTHEKEKIGPGMPLIKTDKGWLFIYHAVGEINANICKIYGLKSKIERGYSVCAAILDLNNPREVLCRTSNPIYIPSKSYELNGDSQYPVDVPAVVFPMGSILVDNKLLIYCGAGDKYIILLSCNLNSLINYLFENCRTGQKC